MGSIARLAFSPCYKYKNQNSGHTFDWTREWVQLRSDAWLRTVTHSFFIRLKQSPTCREANKPWQQCFYLNDIL